MQVQVQDRILDQVNPDLVKWRSNMVVNLGLLVRLEARADREGDVEEFLRHALPLAKQEPATAAWFGLRFGRFEYGIFDVFFDEAGRDAHLAGPIAKELMGRADELFTKPPRIQRFNVLADKLPAAAEPVTKALLLTFKSKAGHAQQVEQFLRGAKSFVDQEPKTAAWFAIHLDDGDYGIFDVFPDNGGRFSHLTGHVPRELGKHALSLLGSVPDLEMLEVLAAKFEPIPG
jgi:quinol monooxygenase YgiN